MEERIVTTLDTSHQQAVARQGAEDAGEYFRYMADYVGFTSADADAIRQTKPVIEKHLPEIVSKFYAHILRYPPTRKFFLNTDGTLNQEYLELRMRHLTNFWLRAASGSERCGCKQERTCKIGADRAAQRWTEPA